MFTTNGHDIIRTATGERVGGWSYDHANFGNGGGIIRLTLINGEVSHASDMAHGLSLVHI